MKESTSIQAAQHSFVNYRRNCISTGVQATIAYKLGKDAPTIYAIESKVSGSALVEVNT